MSAIYDEYIQTHKENVGKAFDYLVLYLPELFENEELKSNAEYLCKFAHDESKHDGDEYEAYDNYFYGNRSYATTEEFNKAWLKHIHKNPHHWQHWILINDDPSEGEKCLAMPDEYIIEMICDWWSFSWKSGDLTEIFDWYDERKEHIKLNSETRAKVNYILDLLKAKLNEE